MEKEVENEELITRAFGLPWKHESPIWKFMEDLPLSTGEEKTSNSPRYLLPRPEVYTFGLSDGMHGRLVYYRCKTCKSVLKGNQIKPHMKSSHLKSESVLLQHTCSNMPSTSNKIKKPLHKTKKKIFPPPAVPPPPLFQKNTTSAAVTIPSVTESSMQSVKEDSTINTIPEALIAMTYDTRSTPQVTSMSVDIPILIPATVTATPTSSSVAINGIPLTVATISKSLLLHPANNNTTPLPAFKHNESSTINKTSNSALVSPKVHKTKDTKIKDTLTKTKDISTKTKDASTKTSSTKMKDASTKTSSTKMSSTKTSSTKPNSTKTSSAKIKDLFSKSKDVSTKTRDFSSKTRDISSKTRDLLCKTKDVSLKSKEVSSKSKISTRKRPKLSSTSQSYNSDHNCGVIVKGEPCLRAINCSIHTITERRAVSGRSKSLDRLIMEYKASRIKNKLYSNTPINIAPKRCSPEDVAKSLEILGFIYNNQEDTSVKRKTILKITTPVPKILKGLIPAMKAFKSKKMRSIPRLYLHTNQDGEQNGDIVPSGLPNVYSAHPKPITVPTPLRRVGHTFVLQQGQRLDRQRLDLQAVANQHKQIKLSSPKTVYLVSNNNKHSILKNNIKNIKNMPAKRSLEKNSTNEIKNVKLIGNELNGFLLKNEIQDKVSLLK